MRRVVRIVDSAGHGAQHVDSVILTADQRRMQTGHLAGVNGTTIGVMLPEPVMLCNGDALELDDGTLVDVVIAPEPLVEIRGTDLTHLARLAWHLGDRHVPVQIFANRLRMHPDTALETMLKALGARLVAIEAPFDPEGGAYAHRPDAHGHDHHGHDHGRSHDHDHGGHHHGHKHDHD